MMKRTLRLEVIVIRLSGSRTDGNARTASTFPTAWRWSEGMAPSEWIVLSRILDRHPAQIGEFGDRGLAAEAAVARALDAAEGHLRLVADGRAVDVADAGLD